MERRMREKQGYGDVEISSSSSNGWFDLIGGEEGGIMAVM